LRGGGGEDRVVSRGEEVVVFEVCLEDEEGVGFGKIGGAPKMRWVTDPRRGEDHAEAEVEGDAPVGPWDVQG